MPHRRPWSPGRKLKLRHRNQGIRSLSRRREEAQNGLQDGDFLSLSEAERLDGDTEHISDNKMVRSFKSKFTFILTYS